MKSKICLYLVVFALMQGGPALGADSIVLELDRAVVSQPVAPGEYAVSISDLLAMCSYEIKVAENVRPIDELSIGEEAEGAAPGTRSVLQLGTFDLERGEELVVEVTQVKENGCEKKEWKFVITTGDRGEWRTTYGFTFVPERDREYFSRQLEDDPEKFEIVREQDRGDFDFLPSVLFTWLPASGRLEDWDFGLTAGLGANTESIAVLLGVSGMYNENLTLTAGLAMHEQSRLEGNFNEGQIIAENLDGNALTEDVYEPTFYFGISLRLDANPFAKKK